MPGRHCFGCRARGNLGAKEPKSALRSHHEPHRRPDRGIRFLRQGAVGDLGRVAFVWSLADRRFACRELACRELVARLPVGLSELGRSVRVRSQS